MKFTPPKSSTKWFEKNFGVKNESAPEPEVDKFFEFQKYTNSNLDINELKKLFATAGKEYEDSIKYGIDLLRKNEDVINDEALNKNEEVKALYAVSLLLSSNAHKGSVTKEAVDDMVLASSALRRVILTAYALGQRSNK